jgi:hypothetical protein
MTHVEGLLGTVAGFGALILGLSGRKFYALGPGQRPKATTKPIPRWFGASWFCIWAGVALYVSVPALRGSWNSHDLSEAEWIVGVAGVAVVASFAFRRLSYGLHKDYEAKSLSLFRKD